MKSRIRIDGLHIDLRGIDPALAEAVVPLLGPALQSEFSSNAGATRSTAHIDAGRVTATGDARAIAERIARQIVTSTRAESMRAESTRVKNSREE